ncbi:hypothetical protein FKM82_020473 [Ascaphus truei]
MAQLLLSLCLLGTALHTGCSKDALSHKPSVVTVSRGSPVILNCTTDNTKLGRYSSMWSFSHKIGQSVIEKWSSTDQNYSSKKVYVEQIKYAQSSLVIKDASINYTGFYNCTISITLPPPSMNVTGSQFHLTVQVAPRMNLSHDEDGDTVTCTASEFYPQPVTISLNTTCGGFGLNDSRLVTNTDGTYSSTYRYGVNISSCDRDTEVTCAAEHQAVRISQTIWIPPVLLKKGRTCTH